MAKTVTATEHHIDMMRKYIEYHCWVTQAKQKGRFFRITASGNFSKLKKELKKRGFIEHKNLPSESFFYSMPNSILLEEAANGNDYEQALVARMVGKRPPDLVWVARAPAYNIFKTTPLLNKIFIKGENFTTKNGMLKYIHHIKYIEKNPNVINFPRSHNLSNATAINTFKTDFRFTAAIGLIQFLCKQTNLNDYWFTPEEIADTTIGIYGLDYAIHVIFMHIKYADGNLTKDELAKCCSMTEPQWIEILNMYTGVVKYKKKIYASNELRDYYVTRLKMVGRDIPRCFLDRKHDGLNNIWMIKPCYSCQGFGIVLTDNEDEILDLVSKVEGGYIVQKYIERPLLIFRCKFDLRQYYLITMDNDYIRFWSHWLCSVKLASTEFTFEDLTEKCHITNTTVQKKYRRESTEELPYHHMWSIHTLIDHFEKIGHPNVWEKKIYPSIKRTLRTISKMAYENVELKPGRFELFGADWLITDDFETHLLEINRCPSMYYYTPVSEYVVGKIYEDLIKVVIDKKDNKKASTGGFEVIYRKDMPDSPKIRAAKLRAKMIEEDLRLAQKMIEKVFEEIVTDAITHINVEVPEELDKKTIMKQVDEVFDPYKLRLLPSL